jgi:hypothetical protein
MSVLSRSVTAAQRGRSFTGAPAFGAEEGAPLTAGTCRCHTGGEVPPGSLGYATVTVLRPAGSSAVPFPGPRPAPEGGRMDRLRNSFADREAGMATAEYAIATLAAVAFAALLVAVLGSGEVRSLLMGLIRSALTLG